MLRTTLSLVALLAASAASAQGVFDNQDLANDQVENIQDRVADDFQRTADAQQFGPNRQQGSYGSIALNGNLTSGNTETTDVGLGSKFGFTNGANGHDFALSYLYGEDAGTKSTNAGAFSYDYTRSFNNNLYAFGDLTARYDEFGSFEQDIFVGGGLGYRIYNTANAAWSLQGGPGYRMVEYNDGTSFEEGAAVLSSKYYQTLGQGTVLTMDTDVLWSDSDTAVTNDLGLTVSMGGPLALRTSLMTEYHTDPLAGRKDTDNTFGVSLVYSFR